MSKKNWISLLLGIASYTGMFFPFHLSIGALNILFYWSLILIFLVSLAWGWRQGLFAFFSCFSLFVIFKRHSFHFFDLASLFVLNASSFFIHGIFAEKKKKNRKWIYNSIVIQLIFSTLVISIYFLLNFLTGHNNSGIVLNMAINLLLLAFWADILINFPFVRKFFAQVETPFMKYNTVTLIISLGVGAAISLIDFGLIYFMNPDTPLWPLNDSVIIKSFLIITICMHIGSQLVHMIERQLEAVNFNDNNRKQLELIVQKKMDELEAAQDELMITNKELSMVNEALHSYQLELEKMVDEKVALLYEEQQFKSTIVDSIQSAIVVLDVKGFIVSINRNIEQSTGYPQKDVAGNDFIDLFISESEKESIQLVLKNFENNRQPVSLRSSIKTRNGDRRLFLWTFGCVVDKSNQLKYVIGSGTDLTERTLLFEALREREEGYKTLFDNMPIGIAIFKPVWKFNGEVEDALFQDINPAASQMTRLKNNEVKGRTATQLGFQDYISLSKLSEIIRTGKHISNEVNYTGTDRFFSILTFKYKDGFAITIEDITERKKTERALIQSEEKFRNIFQSSKDGILILNEEHKIIEINPSFLERLDYTKEELANHYLFDLIDTSYHQIFDSCIKQMYDGETIDPFEVEILSKNCELLSVEFSSQLINFEGQTAILNIIRDVSERKKAEKALRISEQKFRNIFNSTKDVIIISDTNRTILNVNKTFFESTGFSPEEITSLKTTDLIPESYNAVITERVKEMAQGLAVSSIEIEFYHKNGDLIPIELNSRLIEYEGKPAVMAFIKDIRYRREYERQLFETVILTEENERKRFAGDLHDEIGPLLSSLGFYISTLKNKNLSPEHEKVFDRVMEILKETVSKVREISHNLSPHLVENHGLHNAIKHEISLRKDHISFEFQTNIETLRFDFKIEIALYRIVKELIQNTLKHSQAANIIILIQYQNNLLNLLYHDNGVGFNIKDVMNDSSKGIGIYNIISRLKSIKGNHSFNNNPAGGFNIEITVPVALHI